MRYHKRKVRGSWRFLATQGAGEQLQDCRVAEERIDQTWSRRRWVARRTTAVAQLCGVRRQSVYVWIKEWKVERLVDALKLAKASGIPIERLAGVATEP